MKTLAEAKVMYSKMLTELTKKKIPCRIKLNGIGERFDIIVECGRDYPDKMADKIFDMADKIGLKDFSCCAEQSGGTDYDSDRIAGGPKRY